jgi:hypothetical protein
MIAEARTLNKNRLNRVAARFLKKVGEPPKSHCLSSLLLAIWGLENLSELPEPASKYRAELLEQANRMLNWSPEKAEALLVNQDSGLSLEKAALETCQQIESLSPQEAASYLIENLLSSLNK